MKTPVAQIHARLEWASTLCSWKNVHDEMKPAVTGLVRRGLLTLRNTDKALTITPAGKEFLQTHNSTGANFWTDAWSQKIPR
jgi:hypothetical protein